MTPTRMKEIRKALGLSQKAMARALRLKGTDGRAIRQWEKGEREPSGPVTLLYEIFERPLDRDLIPLRKLRIEWR